jgi:hypothetical protein
MTRSEQEIGEILNTGILMIQGGQATVESLLEQFADCASQLRPLLEAACWLQDRRALFDPRPGFLPASRQRLILQIESERQPAYQGGGSAWDLSRGASRPAEAFYRLAVGLFLLILLFIGGWSVSLAAKNAIPGEPFYQIKIVQEQLALAASNSEYGDVRLQVEYTRRRFSEIQRLVIEERYEAVPLAAVFFDQQLDRAVGSLAAIAIQDEVQASQLSTALEAGLWEGVWNFTALCEDYPRERSAEVQQILDIATAGIWNLQRLPAGARPPAVNSPLRTPSFPATGEETPLPFLPPQGD